MFTHNKHEREKPVSPMNDKKNKTFSTPVVLFLFRRPDTTRQVFSTIRQARPSTLFLISDGPRPGNDKERDLCEESKRVVSEVDWPCAVTRIYSETNLGLRERILTGLDEVFEIVDQAIILEDDCLPTESFFSFCNSLLERYKTSPEVALISGFNFAPTSRKNSDYFFSKHSGIWGWATWGRLWRSFRQAPQVETWSTEELNAVRHTFTDRARFSEFVRLAQKGATLNTWDISLSMWIRQQNMLTVVPRTNLISNIGFGGEATHTKFESFDVEAKTGNFVGDLKHPRAISWGFRDEKVAYRRKALRWVVFPILHPINFLSRFIKYFTRR
jgi:hypothetical protein